MIDNCNVEGRVRGFGGFDAVNRGYQAAMQMRILTHERQISTGCNLRNPRQCREICVGRYNA